MAQMQIHLSRSQLNSPTDGAGFTLPTTPVTPVSSMYEAAPKKLLDPELMHNHSYEVINDGHPMVRDCPPMLTKIGDFNGFSYGPGMDMNVRFPGSDMADSFMVPDMHGFGNLPQPVPAPMNGIGMQPFFKQPQVGRNEVFNMLNHMDVYQPTPEMTSNNNLIPPPYPALDAFQTKYNNLQPNVSSYEKLNLPASNRHQFRFKSEDECPSSYFPDVSHNTFGTPTSSDDGQETSNLERLPQENALKPPQTRPTLSASSVLRDQDVEQVDDDRKCKNTIEGTKTSVRRFKRWYKDKYGKELDMNSVNRFNAPEMLKDFFLDIRDTRPGRVGNEYEPVTLTTYRNGLRRYFLYRKVPSAPDNFDLTDKSFDIVNRLLISKRDDLRRRGKGNHPNAIESITNEQLEKMWATGAIGIHAPRPLLRLQWWYNTVYHGIRGRMAHHDLTMEDFLASRGLDGKIMLEFSKSMNGHHSMKPDPLRKKKVRGRVCETDGSERDPIRAFEVFRAHRPPGISSFYLTPKHKPKGNIWFNKVPMGKNSIGRIMREIKAIANIS